MTPYHRSFMTRATCCGIPALLLLLSTIPETAQGLEVPRPSGCVTVTDHFRPALRTGTWHGVACAAEANAASLPGQQPAAIEDRLGLDRAARRLIQQGLQNEGFDPGPPDGLIGPRTRRAIRAWQASLDLVDTGYLDEAQAVRLREAGPRDTRSPSLDRGRANHPKRGRGRWGEARRAEPEPQPATGAVPTAELIQVDRYVLRIERLLETGDYGDAFSVMEEITAIILRESEERTKYELFQRLNTGGSQLSDQEVRNAIDVVRFLREDMGRRSQFAKDGVDAESNLSSRVLRNLTTALGLDYRAFESKAVLIDERLLWNRNRIAHGHYLSLDAEDALALATNILSLMEVFRDEVENAVALSRYKHPGPSRDG